MSVTAIEIEMKITEAWKHLADRAKAVSPAFMMMGRIQYAMLEAHVKFTGRDRRRIKREVNKAIRRAKSHVGQGMDTE